MRLFNFLYLMLFPGLLFSQSNQFIYEQAQKMASAFNENDATKYVEYLLPTYYESKAENKKYLISSFENILPAISDTLTVSRSGIIVEVSNRKQFIFNSQFRGDSCFILGYFDKANNQIYFSQPSTRLASPEILKKDIPNIAPEILTYILPNYDQISGLIIGDFIPEMKLIDLERKPYEVVKKDTGLYIINMWSLSCKPCIEEIPELNELKKKYQESSVEFIAIAWHSDLDIIKNIFLHKHPFHYDQFIITNAESIDLGVFPTHLVVDSHLRIIDKILGATEINIAKMEKYILEYISK